MPGELIRGHEKAEADCANCHVRFDRAAQPRLCMACYKEVGQDVRCFGGDVMIRVAERSAGGRVLGHPQAAGDGWFDPDRGEPYP